MSNATTSAASTEVPPPHVGFKRIVIAVGTDGGVAAIDLAQQLAAPDAVVILVRIHHEPHRIDPAAAENARVRDTSEALRLLRIGRAALDQPCEIVVEDGADLVEALHRVAEREDADLLVVGPHRGLEDEQSALPELLHASPCAVAVVGQRPVLPFAIKRVGVAFCTTPTGAHAAQAAGQVAERHGAQLHAMHVIPVDANPWMGPAAATVHTLQRMDGTLAEMAREGIAQLRPSAEAHLVEGDPAQELAAFAGTVDLLAIGARSTGRLHRLVLGSVGDTLSTQSACALLVVAGPPDAEPSDTTT